MTDLRILASLIAQNCDIKHSDEMSWDLIEFGTNSPKAREKLISKGFALTLDKEVKIAWSFKTSQAQLSAMACNNTNDFEQSVHVVLKQNTRKGPQGDS